MSATLTTEREISTALAAFPSAGEYLAAVRKKEANPCSDDYRLVPVAAAPGMRTDVDSLGGFLSAEAFADRVFSRMYDAGQLLALCDELPLDGQHKSFMPTFGETSRADGSRFGGCRFCKIGETGTITDSLPKFGGQIRKANKFAGLCYVSDETLEDAGSLLEAAVVYPFGQEAAYGCDRQILAGDGSAEGLGVITAGATISVAKATNQTAATVWGSNITGMLARLWGPSHPTAVWAANHALSGQLSASAVEGRWGSEAASAGTIDGDLWSWNGNGRSRGRPTLGGKPVYFCEQAAAVGTVGDLVLFDPSQVGVVLRQRGAWSMHLRFLTNEQAYRIVLYFDCQPYWAICRQSAVRPESQGEKG